MKETSLLLEDIDPSVEMPVFTGALCSSMAAKQGSFRLNLLQPARALESARLYTAGDPVHRIDWKAYARTEQLIIRETRDLTQAQIAIEMTLTPSLMFPDEQLRSQLAQRFPEVSCRKSKMDLVLALGFQLAHAFIHEGDQVYVRVRDLRKNGMPVLYFFHPQSTRELLDSYDFLSRQEAHPEVLSQIFDQVADRTAQLRPQMTIWLGDALDGTSHDYGPMGYSTAKVNLFIQCLSPAELSGIWLDSQHSYFDEALGYREISGNSLMRDRYYDQCVAQWLEQIKNQCWQHDWGYILAHHQLRFVAYEQQLLAELLERV